MDLTIEVMLPPRGARDFEQSANPRYRVLALVAVYPPKTPAAVNLPCTGYIHVTGVPERSAVRGQTEDRMKQLNACLCKAWEAGILGGTEPITQVRERRIWAMDVDLLSSDAKAALLAERQITVTWAQFKRLLRHLVEARPLVDTDLD